MAYDYITRSVGGGVGPSGADWGRRGRQGLGRPTRFDWGRVGPSRAEWGREGVGQSLEYD